MSCECDFGHGFGEVRCCRIRLSSCKELVVGYRGCCGCCGDGDGDGGRRKGSICEWLCGGRLRWPFSFLSTLDCLLKIRDLLNAN